MHQTLGVILAAALGAAALAGCSTPRSSHPADAASITPSVSGSPYVDTPTAIPTTAPGTDLAIGASATVDWRPRNTRTAMLDITVTSIGSTTFAKSFKGWKLTSATLQTTPYFVRATVINSGKSKLDGLAAPLYALDSSNELVQASSFKQAFKPCTSASFPPHFGPGQATQVCLVFLVPKKSTLVGVAFRPDESLAPITWKGPITSLATSSPSAKSSKKPQKSKKS